MMPEYDFKNGVRGKHYQAYREGHTVTVHQKDGTTQVQHFINAKDLSNPSQTNWKALESDSDENIDYSDIPPLTDKFFEQATLRIPVDKA
jgi:hypothetical protein